MSRRNIKPLLALIVVVLLGAFWRLFQLQSFPVQLNHDEISQLYDAISVAKTGKDIYGNNYPFIFPSINDNKPPFYTYATALVYRFAGDKEWIIKVPDLLGSILTIPAVFFFCWVLFKNFQIGILASFFSAIAPFEIFFGRKSFESGVGVLLMLVGFSLLISFLENHVKKFLYLGLIILSLAMYVYFSQVVLIPILLITFFLIYRKEFLRVERRKAGLIALIFFALLIIPLLWIVSQNPLTHQRTQDVFVTQDANLANLLSYNPGNNLINWVSRQFVILNYSFNRYLEQLDPKFLFVNGLDFLDSPNLGVGPLYLFQLPLLLMGMAFIIRKTNFTKQKLFIASWILIGLIPSGLTFETHSPHRVLMVFVMLNIISAIGFYYLVKIVNNSGFRTKIWLIYSFASLIICFSLAFFWYLYTVSFPVQKSEQIHYPFKQVALYAWSQYQNYDQIIFDPYFGELAPHMGVAGHYYLAYYGHYPPAQFQKNYHQTKEGISFDKFYVRKVNWNTDISLRRTLIIASNWSLPPGIEHDSKTVKNFYFYNGKPAFYAVALK